MKMPHETSLGSAINSFYSDIASIEKSAADIEKEKSEAMRLAATAAAAIESASPSPLPIQMPPQDAEPQEAIKEKKKKKVDSNTFLSFFSCKFRSFANLFNSFDFSVFFCSLRLDWERNRRKCRVWSLSGKEHRRTTRKATKFLHYLAIVNY